MVIFCPKKEFMKNDKKLLKKKNYIIFDAESSTNKFTRDLKPMVIDKYSQCNDMETLSPSAHIYSCIGADKGSNEYYTWKSFLLGRNISIKLLDCVKSQFMTADDEVNAFVVFPNKIYKKITKEYIKRLHKMIDVDFEFVVTLDEALENKKLLRDSFTKKQRKDLLKAIKKAAKKEHILSDANIDNLEISEKYVKKLKKKNKDKKKKKSKYSSVLMSEFKQKKKDDDKKKKKKKDKKKKSKKKKESKEWYSYLL